MDRFKIISEGQKLGVSNTCKKYNISRTIYYRWLKRYKEYGTEGLNDIKKAFTPSNKTPKEIENSIFMLVKSYPKYGPREIQYLLEELGYKISESGVYNVLKRNNLSTRENRLKYARKKKSSSVSKLPNFEDMNSGECWLFWITTYGEFTGSDIIYEYTIFDYKSKIACSRLYRNLSLECFEDLLTAVAIPVAQSLNFETKHLCFFDDYNIKEKRKLEFLEKLQATVQSSGYDIMVHLINNNESIENLEKIKSLEKLKREYNNYCLSYLMPFFQSSLEFSEIKLLLQKHIRSYNISQKFSYGDKLYSPIEYHMAATGSDMILPLWAYMDRRY